MLKNKLKALLIMLIVGMLVISPFVFAEDENTNDVELISEENGVPVEEREDNQTTTDEYLNNMKKEDVYLMGDEITIDYIVDGNLFVLANKVNINSQIVGNAFICAKDVNISTQSYISNSLFVTANTLNVDGVTYDVYATCKNAKISGYVYRDFKCASEDLNIFGTIGRNAYISSKNINFSQNVEAVPDGDNADQADVSVATVQGKIMGNLNYSSSKEIQIPESTVDGEVKFEQEKISNSMNFGTYIIALISTLLLVLAVYGLFKWLSPKFIDETNSLLTNKIGSSIGFGILSLIVIPVVAAALIFLNITRPISIVLLLTYIVLLLLSIPVFTIALNNIICTKLKISKTWPKIGMLLATSLVMWLLTIIPFVGALVGIIYTVLGLGIITKKLLPKKSKK